MTKNVKSLLEKMTPEEQAEVETFAAFILARRKLKNVQVLINDIPTPELAELIENSGGFEWLSSEDEDVYSIKDGEEVEWENIS